MYYPSEGTYYLFLSVRLASLNLDSPLGSLGVFFFADEIEFGRADV